MLSTLHTKSKCYIAKIYFKYNNYENEYYEISIDLSRSLSNLYKTVEFWLTVSTEIINLDTIKLNSIQLRLVLLL